MFRSIGIDSVGFSLRVKAGDMQNLRIINGYHNGEKDFTCGNGIWVHELKGGRAFVQCNLPKILYKHNIRLIESPEESGKAIDWVENATGLPLHDALITNIDITSCFSSKFCLPEVITTLNSKKKGYVFQPLDDGVYFNSIDKRTTEEGKKARKSRFTLAVYDKKVEYCRNARKKSLPTDIPLEMEENLIRIEMRLRRAVRAQLHNAGVWSQYSFIGSDLTTNAGFISCIRFFDKRLPGFLYLSSRKGIRQKKFYKNRTALYEEVFREYLQTDWYVGELTGLIKTEEIAPKLFRDEMERLKKARESGVGENVLQTVRGGCKALYRQYPCPITRK
jgi:hypothetical protein